MSDMGIQPVTDLAQVAWTTAVCDTQALCTLLKGGSSVEPGAERSV